MQLCGVIAQDALLHGVCFAEVVREGVVGIAWWREGDINNPNFSELSYLTGLGHIDQELSSVAFCKRRK